MTLRLIQRRKRRDINAADAQRAYQDLLRHPTNAGIDTYIAQFNPPTGGKYVLAADDYDVARYLLTVIHCAYTPNAPKVFLDTLGLKLNNSMDDYRLALARLEKQLLSKAVTSEADVRAPTKTRPVSQTVLSPKVTTQHDRDARGGQRVSIL